MVHFRDISSFDKKYLVISKDQDDATEKGLSLLVEKPIIGRFSPIWPKQNDLGDIVEWTYDTSQNPDSPSRAWSLRTSLHKNTTESNPLRTLGRRIIFGMAKHVGAQFSEPTASLAIHLTIGNGLKMSSLVARRLLSRPRFSKRVLHLYIHMIEIMTSYVHFVKHGARTPIPFIPRWVRCPSLFGTYIV